ncbi:hypothetical protein OAH77_04375 [Flavobacteriaceae bacterium]|nr:hypothetical protein [Flavobacteriaceae bacterium]
MLQIKTQDQFIKTLINSKLEYIILHYNCPFCGNPQISDEEEVEDIIEVMKEHGYIPVGYQCMSCFMISTQLKIKNISEIELL